MAADHRVVAVAFVAAMKNYILAALDHFLNWIVHGVLLPYDMLIALPSALPYFWVKVVLGTALGLFIPRKIIGLVACVVVNVALFAYAAFVTWHPGSSASLMEMLHNPYSYIIVFAGVVWWVVGRIMRWAFYKIRGHAHASAS
jgi:hypothetical protein